MISEHDVLRKISLRLIPFMFLLFPATIRSGV